MVDVDEGFDEGFPFHKSSKESLNYICTKKDNVFTCCMGLEDLSSSLKPLINNPTFSDVTILVGPYQTPIYLHRSILSMRSTYFGAMFSATFKEASSSIIKKPNVLPHIFLLVLEFLYTGRVEITEEDIIEVWYACEEMGISQVVEQCKQFYATCVNPDKVFQLLETHLDAEPIWYYVESHSAEVLTSPSIYSLSKQAMFRLMEKARFGVCEIEVFKVLCKWAELQAEPNDNEGSLTDVLNDVLPLIHFDLMTAEELGEVVEPTGLVGSDVLCNAYKRLALSSGIPIPTHLLNRREVLDVRPIGTGGSAVCCRWVISHAGNRLGRFESGEFILMGSAWCVVVGLNTKHAPGYMSMYLGIPKSKHNQQNSIDSESSSPSSPRSNYLTPSSPVLIGAPAKAPISTQILQTISAAKLRVISRTNSSETIVRDFAHHQFDTNDNPTWGWVRFAKMDCLMDISKGFMLPDDDSLLLEMEVYA